MTTPGRISVVMALSCLAALACGSRSPLRTGDAAAFVDDDPWLKIDAGADARRDGGDARPPDGPRGAHLREPERDLQQRPKRMANLALRPAVPLFTAIGTGSGSEPAPSRPRR